MTNPAQLKYLDAMGIPVWVSRELIVDEGNTDEAVKDVQNANKLDQQTETKKTISSAVSLIETLDNAPPVKGGHVLTPTNTVSQAPKEAIASPPPINHREHTDQVKNEIGCTSIHTLFASGSLSANWMVIGQSPDVNDSAMNQPYPHESGDLLNNMLRAIGLDQPRTESYWLNILKSPKRVEEQEESNATIELNKLLTDKIKEIKPKIILVVGQLAAQNILQSKEPLARIRMQQHKEAYSLEANLPLVVTYYPAYLLSKPQDKAKAWQDLKLAMSLLTE